MGPIHLKLAIPTLVLASLQSGCGSKPTLNAQSRQYAPVVQDDTREVHLRNLRQLTRDTGENAEAYWAFDSSELIMQSKRSPFECDQIYRLPLDGTRPTRVSMGLGRSTCAYFLPGDEEIVYSSTHESGGECPAMPDRSHGYVWPIYKEYNIFIANAKDGSGLRKLTNTPYYDAEATVCSDGSIVFTSTRSGDLDLYRMDSEGNNLVQLTDTPGYDGGAFFSKDCSQIVWRASRPQGEDLKIYKDLLAKGLVKPSKLEIFVANADGSDARQITYLDAASFAPFFHPDGKRVLFSTNFAEGRQEFDIWAVNTDGSNLERITHAQGFDGFPMFSPDGTMLAFSSNRNQANPGETDVYVADWVEAGTGEIRSTGAASFLSDVAWLADDAREGRGIGTEGLEDSAEWLAKRFEELGLVAGVSTSYFQSLDVPVAIAQGPKSGFSIGKMVASNTDFVALGFSGDGSVSGRSLFVGYGIVSEKHGIDDYKGKKLKGKIAVIRRFTPDTDAFRDKILYGQHSSLHRKAFLAREAGAIAVIFVNQAPTGVPEDEEAALPELTLERLRGVGIPVVMAKRSFAHALRNENKSLPVKVSVELQMQRKSSRNVVARLRAGGKNTLPGILVVGAHYDHLGYGDVHSLEDGRRVVHNGADDNASGVAALLQVAEMLEVRKSELRRDIVFVAFTGEEKGLLGSKFFVENMSDVMGGADVAAMLNMDMVGRMRENRLSVMGIATASEWGEIAETECAGARIDCQLGGDGYGPSDQTSFTNAQIPVLYFSTGVHSDYHKASDDSEKVNAIGGRVISEMVSNVAFAIANREQIRFQKTAPKYRQGDRRSFGASLGTIPDYSGDARIKGMLLSGVRPGGAADKAGMKAGDRLLSIDDTQLHSVQDLVYVLQAARPGQEGIAKVLRGKKTLLLRFVFQKSTRSKH